MRIQITAVVIGFLIVSLLWSGHVGIQAQASGSFQVIVHPSNPLRSIDKTELGQLFLKKKTKWSYGTVAKPVDQKLSSAVRQAFSKAVLNKPVSAVNAYWQQRIFSGRDVPPPQKSSDAAVVHYVSFNRGAVGYVSANATIGKTRVIAVVD